MRRSARMLQGLLRSVVASFDSIVHHQKNNHKMPTIHFIGRIVPVAGINISATDMPVTKYASPENDLQATFTFRINNSTVDVECELNRFSNNDPHFLALIHKPAFDLTQAIVSLIGFQTGYGLTLCFEYIVNPDGIQSYFRTEHPELAALCTAFSLTSGLPDILRLVLSDFYLCIALNELNEAITLTHHAVASCARCIERLRTIMSPTLDRKHAWIRFGETLQLSKDYLKLISDYSTGARHGDPTFIPGI